MCSSLFPSPEIRDSLYSCWGHEAAWSKSLCAQLLLLLSRFSRVSDSVRPHRRQPMRLPRPWDSPGENTGVGCHFLLQCMKVKSESEVAESCPTLSDPMDCSPPDSSTHGIFQARVLEWGAIAFSCAQLHSCLFCPFWDGQGSLVCCSPWMCKELGLRLSDWTELIFCCCNSWEACCIS